MNEPVDKLTFSCDLIVEQQKRIVELESKLAGSKYTVNLLTVKSKERIAELEKERDALHSFVIKRLPSISSAASFSDIAKSIEGEAKSLLAKRDIKLLYFCLANIATPENIYTRVKQLCEGAK